MNYDSNNIFAKIIRGEIPANKIYEDEKVLAFHDISKSAPTHVLVIPKGEYVNFSDFASKAKSEEISYFFSKVNEIAKILKVDESGFRLIANVGPNAHQTVPHFHLHILAGKKMGPLLSSDNLLR
jgi:diadenosine tetraphosphate (Ap4A) HIT family hydrolase